MTIVLPLFIMILLLWLMAIAAADDNNGNSAVVTWVSGKATCTRPGQEGIRLLKRGDQIKVADTVETNPDARLQLRLIDGTVINISAGSGLRISQYAFDKNSLRRSTVITFLRGSARFFVLDPADSQPSNSKPAQRIESSNFSILTSEAQIDVWKADFAVETATDESNIYNFGGSVAVRNRSKLVVGATRIGENLSVVVRSKVVPTTPSIISQHKRRIFARDARQF